MLAANYNITLDRAADYSFVLGINNFNGAPVNLTGDSFEGDIRFVGSKSQALEFSFTNGGSNGQVLITLTAEQTKQLRSGTLYEYDVFLKRSAVNGGQTVRLIEGTVTVRAQRTNDV
jgi:hypothetical protein